MKTKLNGGETSEMDHGSKLNSDRYTDITPNNEQERSPLTKTAAHVRLLLMSLHVVGFGQGPYTAGLYANHTGTCVYKIHVHVAYPCTQASRSHGEKSWFSTAAR